METENDLGKCTVSFALGALCDAWDGKNDGGYYRGNVTNATANGRRALALSQAGAGGGVVVRPLEWERFWFGSNDDIRAWRPTNSIISSAAFIISMDGDSWTEGACEHGKFPNLAAAQTARQQEYNARILAALAPSPSAVGSHEQPIGETQSSLRSTDATQATPAQPTASVEAVAQWRWADSGVATWHDGRPPLGSKPHEIEQRTVYLTPAPTQGDGA